MEPANRIEQYLDFMLYILRADGVVDREEKRHLLSMMVDGMKLHPDLVKKYRDALDQTEWPEVSDQQLASVCQGLDASSLAHLVRDAYSMAASDGEIHSAELALLKRFLTIAGIPEERFSRIDEWARQSLSLAHRGTLLLERPLPE
jgi:uncharacterized tellurite resistance protein B-like protein